MSEDELILYGKHELPEDSEYKHLVTKSHILGMGWTAGMIEKYSPAPVLRMTPHGKHSPCMKLWRDDVIAKAMESEDFKHDFERIEKRRADKAGKAV